MLLNRVRTVAAGVLMALVVVNATATPGARRPRRRKRHGGRRREVRLVERRACEGELTFHPTEPTSGPAADPAGRDKGVWTLRRPAQPTLVMEYKGVGRL